MANKNNNIIVVIKLIPFPIDYTGKYTSNMCIVSLPFYLILQSLI